MSFQLINRAWKVRGLNHVAKLVLLRLADAANSEGICWPKRETLAADCCASQRAVNEAISGLQTLGHITEREISKRGFKEAPRFEYHVHPLSTPEVGSPVTQEAASSVTPATSVSDTGNQRHRHRQPASPTQEMASSPINRTPKNHDLTVTEPTRTTRRSSTFNLPQLPENL